MLIALTAPITPIVALQTANLPLANPGPYHVALQVLTFVDHEREDSKLAVSIWYPAVEAPTAYQIQMGSAMTKDIAGVKLEPKTRSTNVAELEAGQLLNVVALQGRWAQVEAGEVQGWILSENLTGFPGKSDVSHAPYPVILYSHGLGDDRWSLADWLYHLASYGYVVVAIGHNCDTQITCMLDRPLDVKFVLDQLAAIKTGNLANIIDTNNAGMTGVSYGGYTSLVMAGLKVKPDNAGEQSAKRGANLTALLNGLNQGFVKGTWQELLAYRATLKGIGDELTSFTVTDPRIHAVLPVVPAFGVLFDESGIKAAIVPTLIMASTQDSLVSYEREIVPLITDMVGEKDRYFLSLIGYDHDITRKRNGTPYYKQFATAFFGLYIQGKKEYAQYLTVDYTKSLSDLAWGVYVEPK